MQRILFCLFSCMMFSGCVTTQSEPIVVSSQEIIASPKTVKVQEKEVELVLKEPSVADIETEEIVKPLGVIFARTEFQGVLDTDYVKLFVESLDVKDFKFQLHVGEVLGQQDSIYEIKNVRPGFFFLELPEGKYVISSVSIPVGSTLATEECLIYFNVTSDQVHYLGALKMVGTKEKIKLGGVPVIKPGFEYKIEIVDETQEAKGIFMKNFPLNEKNILTQLMVVESNRGDKK